MTFLKPSVFQRSSFIIHTPFRHLPYVIVSQIYIKKTIHRHSARIIVADCDYCVDTCTHHIDINQ